MKIAIHDHQTKAQTLARMLLLNGHELTEESPDLLLLDHSGPPYYEKIAKRYPDTPIVLYSHGARSCIAWDGIWKLNERVVGYLAFSDGERAVMEAYGFPKPVEVAGWHWCELKPLQPRVPHRILFAPSHALANGWSRKELDEANVRAFELLTKMPVGITVRVYGKRPEYIKTEAVEEIQFADGSLSGACYAIDNTDLVVTYPGTFAYLALARGKPTVMYGQSIPPGDYVDGETKLAAAADKYTALWHYPLELFEGEAWGVVQQAGSGYAQGIDEWRETHIGQAATPHLLEKALRILLEPKKEQKTNGSNQEGRTGHAKRAKSTRSKEL